MDRIWKFAFGAVALTCIASFKPKPQSLNFKEDTRRTPSSLVKDVSNLLRRGHSHNDYERERPLADALENGLNSVEADIWLVDSRLLVSHLGYVFTGSLRELYLDPLQERVNRIGSVYGDGKQFLLWLDVKENDPRIVVELHRLLAAYPMFTRFGRSTTEQGPVVAVMTGNESVKRNYEERYPLRYAIHDSLSLAPEDDRFSRKDGPDGRCWYSLRWFQHMEWAGDGEVPAEEKAKLDRLVELVHRKGCKLRFWGAPESSEIWRTTLQSGVDLIGIDAVGQFNRFVRSIDQ